MTDGSGTQNRCAHTDWFVWRAGDRPPPSFSLIGWLLTKMKNPTGGTKRPGHHSIFVSGPSTHLPDFCNARPTQRVTKNAPPVHPKNDERVNASLCQRVPRRSGAPRASMPRMHVDSEPALHCGCGSVRLTHLGDVVFRLATASCLTLFAHPGSRATARLLSASTIAPHIAWRTTRET